MTRFNTAGISKQAVTAVRMALLLEHLPDPRAFIIEARQKFCNFDAEMLPIRGSVSKHALSKIMLIVPNERNPLQKLVERSVGYSWYVQRPHINYFTKNSIKRLLHTCGFRTVFQTGTFPMELLYLRGYKYIGNDAIGQRCHQIRLDFERRYGKRAFDLYHLLYTVLGWGRETIIIGEKLA